MQFVTDLLLNEDAKVLSWLPLEQKKGLIYFEKHAVVCSDSARQPVSRSCATTIQVTCDLGLLDYISTLLSFDVCLILASL